MPDREKVMGWLEGLAEPDWRECYSDSEVREAARQALDLIDELLKEYQEKQEGLPPAWQDRTQEHICQKCGGIVWQEDNYCSKCGQAVKWT